LDVSFTPEKAIFVPSINSDSFQNENNMSELVIAHNLISKAKQEIAAAVTPAEKLEILEAVKALAAELIPQPFLSVVNLVIAALEATIHAQVPAQP
jgi:hypothetical protein